MLITTMTVLDSLVPAHLHPGEVVIHLAHEEIYRRRYTPAEEQAALVRAVRFEDVRDLARRYLAPERYALTVLGPAPGGEIGEADWPVREAVEASSNTSVP